MGENWGYCLLCERKRQQFRLLCDRWELNIICLVKLVVSSGRDEQIMQMSWPRWHFQSGYCVRVQIKAIWRGIYSICSFVFVEASFAVQWVLDWIKGNSWVPRNTRTTASKLLSGLLPRSPIIPLNPSSSSQKATILLSLGNNGSPSWRLENYPSQSLGHGWEEQK